MRERAIIVVGVVLAGTIIWQALELRRLSASQAGLESAIADLQTRLEPLALTAETAAVEPAPSAVDGASPSEMEPPRGPQPDSVFVEGTTETGERPPTVDTTGGGAGDPPPPTRCASACQRALSCAMESCDLGTGDTDGLVESCMAGCNENEDLAKAIDEPTDCEDVTRVTVSRLPAYQTACRR